MIISICAKTIGKSTPFHLGLSQENFSFTICHRDHKRLIASINLSITQQ